MTKKQKSQPLPTIDLQGLAQVRGGTSPDPLPWIAIPAPQNPNPVPWIVLQPGVVR